MAVVSSATNDDGAAHHLDRVQPEQDNTRSPPGTSKRARNTELLKKWELLKKKRGQPEQDNTRPPPGGTELELELLKKTKKRGIDAVDDDEKENEAEKGATQSALPTRKEAIAVASKNEVDVFLGTSFTKTGDAAQDRVLRSLKTNPAQWEKW